MRPVAEAGYPRLCWRLRDLPERLRELDRDRQLIAKGILNARLLNNLPADEDDVIEELRRRRLLGR